MGTGPDCSHDVTWQQAITLSGAEASHQISGPNSRRLPTQDWERFGKESTLLPQCPALLSEEKATLKRFNQRAWPHTHTQVCQKHDRQCGRPRFEVAIVTGAPRRFWRAVQDIREVARLFFSFFYPLPSNSTLTNYIMLYKLGARGLQDFFHQQ